MALRFIGIDPNTDGDHCPTVWVDDETKEIVIQGWKAGPDLEAQARAAGPLPDTEAVVRLPARMAKILREAAGVADDSDVQ